MKKIHWIEINGGVELPIEVSEDKFTEEFIIWCESKGYCFCGVTKEDN